MDAIAIDYIAISTPLPRSLFATPYIYLIAIATYAIVISCLLITISLPLRYDATHYLR